MSFSVIIPARFGSTRLPGKPLLDIAGKPMIQRVYEQAVKSDARRVIIATDDERILQAAQGFAAEAVMTSAAHESGTDRLQEVVARLNIEPGHIVVNVQGDEPLIPAAVINQVAELLGKSRDASVATLVEKISDPNAVFNPNVVKVVADNRGRALYFSRAPVPWYRDGFNGEDKALPAGAEYLRHIGIYAYRVSLLHQFVTWPVGRLEGIERLEQLRVMEHGVSIVVQEAIQAIPGGVDTEADLETVRAFFRERSE